MATNTRVFERTPGWSQARKYTVDNILENLEAYRIATDQIDSKDYNALLEECGWSASRIAKMTDDEKMGCLSRVLNKKREKEQYYTASSSKSKKREAPTTLQSREVAVRKQRQFEKRQQKQLERRELKEEASALLEAGPTNPLVLDFPIPNSTSVPSSSGDVTVFHRPLEAPAEMGLSKQSEISPTTTSPLASSPEEGSLKDVSSPSADSECDSVIEWSKDAPSAPILGPFCVICGKWGQYVCDATDEDVCSMECKRKAEAAHNTSSKNENSEDETPIENVEGKEVVHVISSAPVYVPSKRHFMEAISALDSHKCPLCGKTGHLPQDCFLASGKVLEMQGFAAEETKHFIQCDSLTPSERSELSKLYRKCKAVFADPHQCCAICKSRSNLVYCVTCNACYCDKNHFLEHITLYPSHKRIASFKLKKLIKCSNPNCAECDIYKLVMCHKCSSNLYNKYYNMKTALWRREAILQYPNLICCEEHVTWHLMNCGGMELMTPIVDKSCIENGYYAKDGIVNDMLF